MSRYIKTAQAVRDNSGSLLDAALAVQAIDGWLSREAMDAVSVAYDVPVAQFYEMASFYSMLRFAPAGKTVIQVCRNAPCHVAGAKETIAAFEKALGIGMGETAADGSYTLEYVECQGQCQASPSVVINGTLHTDVTADKVPGLLKARA
jgi:NADH:ubiquinone oxidoreductase 24 kD subunit